MEYIEKYGHMVADYVGELKEFEDKNYETIFIKKYSKRKRSLTNHGEYTMRKAKDIFGNLEITLAYIDNDHNLNIIVEE